MKNLHTRFCSIYISGAQIKILTVAFLFMGLYSCTKEEDGQITNIAAYRGDAAQAQTLDYSTVSTNTILADRVEGVDYIIKDELMVNAGNLIIKPGVTIMFENGAGITVSDGGSLTAIGEQSNEIYFISRNDKRGDWKGITILNNTARNVLSFCHVEHGGNNANTYGQANIILGNSAAAEVSHTEITASSANGITLGKDATVRNFTGNTISSNTMYPVSVHITDAANLQNGNTYANNGKEFIELRGYEGTVLEPVALSPLTEPYIVSGNITSTNSFTINAGTRLYMGNGAQLTISGNGWLSAIGTGTQPVVLSGEYSTSGLWNGINISASASANNKLEYCQITGGGGQTQNHYGMINVMGNSANSSQLTVRNCTIQNSASTGIYIQKNNALYNTDIESANQFGNNAAGNVYFDIN